MAGPIRNYLRAPFSEPVRSKTGVRTAKPMASQPMRYGESIYRRRGVGVPIIPTFVSCTVVIGAACATFGALFVTLGAKVIRKPLKETTLIKIAIGLGAAGALGGAILATIWKLPWF